MASERWKDDIAYAMNPCKFLTWPLGVWPLQVYNVFSLIRCVWTICLAGLLVILPMTEIYMGCTDTEINIDCLLLICCATLGLLKVISFRVYANNLIDNYGSALNDYLTIENGNQRAIMRRHAFLGRFVCYFMMGVTYGGCVVLALLPFLNNDENKQINVTNEDSRKYLIPSRCIMDYLEIPDSVYNIICLIQAIALTITSATNIGNDTMFLNITLHTCGQIKILKSNFMDLDTTSSKIHDCLEVLILRHIHLIQIAKKLTETISLTLLTQLFMSSILLCMMGFQLILSLKINDIGVVIKCFIMLGTFLMQLMLYSFVGDYLKSQLEEVGFYIYQCAWYNFPTKLMKNMIFILMRAQSPVVLQAGHFIMVNLPTFMTILKTSFSYLSVLRVMIET